MTRNLTHNLVQNLAHNLQHIAERFPDRTATYFYGQTLSYRQLQHRVEHLAKLLRTWGVHKGERVLLLLPNSPDWIVAAHAVWTLGAVVVPLSPLLRAHELAFFVQDADIRVGVVSSETYPEVKQAGLARAVVCDVLRDISPANATRPNATQPNTIHATSEGLVLPELSPTELNPIEPNHTKQSTDDVIYTDDDVTHTPTHTHTPHAQARIQHIQQVQVQADDLAIMPYTSGTTGQPRACMHTHRSVQSNILTMTTWGALTTAETTLMTLPVFHVTGLINSLLGPLSVGARLVILARWHRENAHQLLKTQRVTTWSTVTTMLIDLLHMPDFDPQCLAHLRRLSGGGMAMPPALAKRLQHTVGVTFTEGYGLSETMAQCIANPATNPKLGSLGIPTYGVDARILNVLDTSETHKTHKACKTKACTTKAGKTRELGPHEIGEIIVSGPQLMQGYWQRPEENSAAFVEHDGKRFLRTGDLGYYDQDGFFFFVDRIKRMINVAGMKVWPAEVEKQLYAHPAIREVCVIAAPDERTGERVRALIVLKAELTAEDLKTWAREHMASYKVPRDVLFVSELPRGKSGKIAWRKLQESLQERPFRTAQNNFRTTKF